MKEGIISKVVNLLSYRLPLSVLPSLYKLYLHPNLNTQTFSGRIEIQLNIIQSVLFIALHSHKLSIVKTQLYHVGENQTSIVKIKQTFEYPAYEYWVTELENTIDAGDYILDLEFNGSLDSQIVGFYSSSYHDKDTNETRVIATSKFEPTYARQAFPCFDEPALKAPFIVSLVRPTGNGYHALSNMDVAYEELHPKDENLTIVHFNKSVPMSTYLAVFIVSDFVHEKFSLNDVAKYYTAANENDHQLNSDFFVRVFATKSQLQKIQFAGNIGANVIKYYINYFGIDYPLPKLDMAAIPDFVSGAMETWGLVTFRETSLLYDPTLSSTANKQRVAIVVAHEFAHMWFGNLVTMKWWNELWLNEGFASYMEYKGVHQAYPEFGMMDQFLLYDIQIVFSLDATLASHPIVQSVTNPDQITEIFDIITYNKGASIIRMLENFVGETNFQTAVSNYLKNHKYGNASTMDLLRELDNLDLGFNVASIINTWITQKGFPYVTISKKSIGTYQITQRRFLVDPDSYDKEDTISEYQYRWTIPITFQTDLMPVSKLVWFEYTESSIEVSVPKDCKWVKFNKNQIGYYRVLYDELMWKGFTDLLISAPHLLDISDRAALLDDAFSFAEAQLLTYEIALNLTNYLEKEEDFVPWSVAATKLLKMNTLLQSSSVHQKFKTYCQNLVENVYKFVTWKIVSSDANHQKNLLRTAILEFACQVGHKGCLKTVGEQFSNLISNIQNPPHPDIRNLVYYYGMAEAGNEKTWEIMFNTFKSEQDAQEKVKLMYGLTGIADTNILKRFLEIAKDEHIIRSQDYLTVLNNIAGNEHGEQLVWDFVRNNWLYLVERFTLNDRYLGQMIKTITSKFATVSRQKEVIEFFAKHPEAGAGVTSRKQALENIRNNINWLERNTKSITSWLNEYMSPK